jgi:hypothetical protein
MTRILLASVGLLLSLFTAARACMRPEMDERAVQWSTAIVHARLASIAQPVDLAGQTQERQGPRGTLGVSTTTYFYRLYQFEVIDPIEGPYKAGDGVQVLRLFSRSENSLLPCEQHLTKDAVGKEFILMVRPMAEFKYVVPQGVKRPDVKDAMSVVHLERADDLKPDAVTKLKQTIHSVRAGEKQFTPDTVQRLIKSIQKAPTDARAEPSIRALERMGPRVMADVQAAADKAHGEPQARLLRVISELTPPDPVNILLNQPPKRLGEE